MNITDFTNKAKLSKRETDICISVYKNTGKTEAEWRIELEGKVTFPTIEDTPEKVEKQTSASPKEEVGEVEAPTAKEIAKKKVEEIKQNKNKKDE